MTAPIRLAAFVAALAVVFAAALGIGAAFGPDLERNQPPAHGTDHRP